MAWPFWPDLSYHKFVSSLCRYDLENYDRESERSKDILNPYKSVIGVILLKIERKIKYQIKIRMHHPTLFSYHHIHTFLILWILCHQYSVTIEWRALQIHIILSLDRTKSSLNSNYTLEVDWNHCTWCRPYDVWSYHISDVGVNICLKYFHYFDYKFEGQKQRTSMMTGLRSNNFYG